MKMECEIRMSNALLLKIEKACLCQSELLSARYAVDSARGCRCKQIVKRIGKEANALSAPILAGFGVTYQLTGQ
jgi:hypothetical protein